MLSPLYGQLSPLRVPTADVALLAANAYIAAVEAADGQSLESGVKSAFTDFIVGCHNDGIWTAIKASCILAGARTLAGALVPLVGSAPTNNNFVSGDYDRETGLKGNGSTKYLDSNRNNNADPQNNNHNSVYVNDFNGNNFVLIGAADPFNENGANSLGVNAANQLFSRSRSSLAVAQASTVSNKTLAATSRSASGSYNIRVKGTSANISTVSQTPTNRSVFVFARTNSANAPSRISFYSIGESLDLPTLDTRVSTLMTDLAAAIP